MGRRTKPWTRSEIFISIVRSIIIAEVIVISL